MESCNPSVFFTFPVPPSMSTVKCGNRTFLTTEEVVAIFENRKSVDQLSELSSTDGSLQDSFWECSDTDSVVSDVETDVSGSLPAEVQVESSEPSELDKTESEDPSGDEDQPPCKKARIEQCEVEEQGRDTSRGSTSRGSTSRGSTSRGSTSRGSTRRGSTSRGSTSRGSTSRGSTIISRGGTSRGGTSRGSTIISRGGTGCGDTSRGDTSRGGTSRGDTSRGGTSRGGTGRGDTSRGGTSRGDTSRGGTSRGDTSRGGTSHGDTSRGGTSRGGTGRGDTSRGGTSRGDTSRGGTSRGDTRRGGTSRGGTSRGDTSRGDTSRGGTGRGGTSHGGTSRGGTGRGSTRCGSTSRGRQSKDPVPKDAINITVRTDCCSTPEVLFCPLRSTGPHIPLSEVDALSLFELYFDDAVMERIANCTLEYAEAKKDEKRKRYALFMRQTLTKDELMSFNGALILLGIQHVRNQRKAWSSARAQFLPRLHELMTCQRFEIIGCFLHVVTVQEEEETPKDRLRKLRPFLKEIKARCIDYYQPLRELSIDERMVKSKARSVMVQYMKQKPIKWGFKLWVVADTTGYTIDFNIYTGKRESTEHGLASQVVMTLVEPFMFQGYEVFTDNFYTSPTLEALSEVGIRATGTLRINRRGIPDSVIELKRMLEKDDFPRGTGYYYVHESSVYVCWKDSKPITIMTTDYPGHYENLVSRRVQSGRVDIPRPIAIEKYNAFMGGVDKRDQYLAYHNVLHRTVRYWKTLYYHTIDIAVVNAFILYNILAYEAGAPTITENDFRDKLVLQIIAKYGREQREPVSMGRPPRSSCRVRHGSILYSVEEKKRCQYCKLSSKENFT